jgi:pSer/pThr/pTyr-binding forkhead associated (FHA) protein
MRFTHDDVTLSAPHIAIDAEVSEITFEVIAGYDCGREFRLDARGLADVGRALGTGICLGDSGVSRRHAQIRLEETELRVVDLGSKNGTYLNGVRVGEATLHPGDVLLFGATKLRVCVGRDARDVITDVIADGLGFAEARRRVLDAFEGRYLRTILDQHGGNVSRAAAAAGMARRYFYAIRARVQT